jgi:lysophospholipase L1-like esterase
LDYLALGDSYSSGEGDTAKNPTTNHKYYRDYTDNEENAAQNVPREKCHISTRSYPYLLAHGMGLNINNPKQWDSVACAGATAWDVKEQGSDEYRGQGKGARNDNSPRLERYNSNELKIQSLNEFIPGRQKQIEFVKKYKPKVITLTMGGNDIGFANKIRSCITPGTCEITTGDGKKVLANQISGQFINLKSLYEELYKASDSKAKIYILGYPQFINGEKDASCPLNIAMLDAAEREMISNSVKYLDRVIKKAAEAAGVKYIDIENSLDGHKLCDNGDAYVTGVAAWMSSENQESFHPNAKGNTAMASSVWGENNVNGVSLLDYDICPDSNLNACPDPAATKDSIIVPSYFATSDPPVNSQYKEMTSSSSVKGALLHVITGLYSLASGSIAQLTLHSEPINLGSYLVSKNGQLDISTTIPASVPAGYHTLTLTGSTYSGEPIQFEQVILVQGSNPSDIDDNGAPDNQQACLFIPPSGVDADSDGIDDACDPEIGEKMAPSLNKNIPLTLSNNKLDKSSDGNVHNDDAPGHSKTNDVYAALGMTPNQDDLYPLPRAHINDSTSTLRQSIPFDLLPTFIFTVALIITIIVMLMIGKRKVDKMRDDS